MASISRSSVAAVVQEHPKSLLIALTLIPRVTLLLGTAIHRSTPFGNSAHDGYLQIAQNFAANLTLGFDAHHLLYRGPILPILLAPGVLLGHAEFWSAVVHLLAAVGTCLLVFSAAMTLTGNVIGSFGAAALVTLDPWLIWFVKIPMTPVTATFFVAVEIFFFARLIMGRRPVQSAICLGAACALGVLDHPALIAIVGGFTLAILIVQWSPISNLSSNPLTLKGSFVSVTILWIALLAFLSPYVIRNYRDSGRFILVGDSAGLTYLLGTAHFSFSPYPWGQLQPYDGIANRLHVSVADLDVQYSTVDDRFYPELNRQARSDFVDVLLHHPGYLAKRTAVMAMWFFAGDYSIARTAAHVVFLGIVLATWLWAWKRRGFMTIAPFLILVISGATLHSLTMSLNGHAAYSIPYIVPLAMPLAFALASEPANAFSREQYRPQKDSEELYAFE